MFPMRIWHLQVLTAGLLVLHPFHATGDEHLHEGPFIIPATSEIILKKGQNFTIFCNANAPVVIKQQEIPEESTDTFKKVFRNLSSTDLDYRYKAALDLYNVDQFSVGYYACFDEAADENHILNNLLEEPQNNEHAAYIYVYVDETGSLFAPMQEVIKLRNGNDVIIECRPTTPDVNVTLIGEFPDSPYSYSPKIGFTFDTDSLTSQIALLSCGFMRGDETIDRDVFVNKYTNDPAPPPRIQSSSKWFVKGETFSLNCAVQYKDNSALALEWKLPSSVSKDRVNIETNEHNITSAGILYSHITISNATEEDQGKYVCVCTSRANSSEATIEKKYRDVGFIKLNVSYGSVETTQRTYSRRIYVDAYPWPTFQVYKDGVYLTEGKNYNITRNDNTIYFKIDRLSINDTGNYTVVAQNEYVRKNVSVELRVRVAPEINIWEDEVRVGVNTQKSLICTVLAYPPPTITWTFHDGTEDQNIPEKLWKSKQYSFIKTESELELIARRPGTVTCHATNDRGETSSSIKFMVDEVPGGFGVKNNVPKSYAEGLNVTIDCYASKSDFDNVTWHRNDDDKLLNVRIKETSMSYIARLILQNISLEDAGIYTCEALDEEGVVSNYTMPVHVVEKQRPVFYEPVFDAEVAAFPYQPVKLICSALAVPSPEIIWLKDGEALQNTSDGEIMIYTDYSEELNTPVNSSVEIKQMSEAHKGKYECRALSDGVMEIKAYSLIMNEKSPYKSTYLGIAGGLVLLLLVLVVYLVLRVRKEKKFRKELAAAGLLYFKEGVPKSLNPDLGIDEQAELLPYDEKFEFPPEKLIIGKQLGAGAFGVVYKAEARGIINAEEVTPVAVKMVKKTADNMYIKALASELKIMVHLGKHVNIVNLLGACTKNAGKRELLVIVEYCKFGNIHNYIMRHREVFIDQLTDNKEKNFGKVNRGFSYSSGSTGVSDYFGSNHTQNTEHTFLNTGASNRSGRKVSETGYIQPEWRSNYESDYSYDGRSPRPLTSRDLLAWAFQIARGMEYLASRKVLHGDLAARNVLLAEDNVVKICDFGLARSIYKNDEYKKQENSPLPIKWLAIECMTDRIFSTQSDVWSFGVVLWELFSLAKTPYPNVSPTSFLQYLNDGHRLEKPQYADDRLYDVMLQCWQQKPTARPSFTRLQEMLGSFLEDNVRNHYVDLNAAYNDMNKKIDGQEDYLAMVSAPDYNNLVSPSPHHYVNDTQSFVMPPPHQLQHDSDGYLQMSPARQSYSSPRFTGNKFDFDTRKMNVRMTEPNCHGSELTPMLTLNNLPTKESESDQDNSFVSHHGTCPPVEEESDDVFELKQYNIRNAELNKANSQNSAVTNPTYISFDTEKKPKNESNNYINVNIPNGLVK
ncbi:vascular endothelial growth factor receptor 1 isoform X2 [Aricia agestis]|uniref:vascular endothelial growth factor receptor 1 isoform X2 n=1 Tax=Aricia agestis TaxID=91739 RepID=UPI001C20A8B6|nr:vascular endothelial growth factor receptor 1 isoform X2 [Aricia agestis]